MEENKRQVSGLPNELGHRQYPPHQNPWAEDQEAMVMEVGRQQQGLSPDQAGMGGGIGRGQELNIERAGSRERTNEASFETQYFEAAENGDEREMARLEGRECISGRTM